MGENSYAFTTDQGTNYEIGFVEDFMLGIDNVYQFFIEANGSAGKAKDPKIAETVFAVLEEFFQNGNLILDYICDTSDGRHEARSRLFSQWYNHHPLKIGFTMQRIFAKFEGEGYYAAVILRNDNPKYGECITAIDAFSKDILDKLK